MANPLTTKVLVTLKNAIKGGHKLTSEEVAKQFNLTPKIAGWAIRLASNSK